MPSPKPLDDQTRSRMRSQKTKDTAYELALRRALHARGLRYRLQRKIPGTRRTIDIAFVGPRVAVFVDGCFWHMCPEHGSMPTNNASWWGEKLRGNVDRDRRTDALLHESGWHSVRIWEHVPLADAVLLVETALNEAEMRQGGRHGDFERGDGTGSP